MKKTRKLVLFLLATIMILTLVVGCNGSTTETTASPADSDVDTPGTDAPSAEDKKKVALILEGAISDMSWNATAYEGLKKIEALGAETKYVENTPASSGGDAIRAFADDGYNVIFLSSNSFQNIGSEVAKEYPDVQFFMINSDVIDDNVCSFAIQDAEQGFLMGALAALLTESNTVAFVGGLPIQPIINGAKGFEQGVKYVNDSIDVKSQNTGSMDDVGKAKELAKAMVGDGADVLAPMANQASLGVMEAAEEEGVKAIGSGLNQETKAPNAAVVAIVKDTSIAYEAAYKAYLEDSIPDSVLPMGAAQGVVYIGDYYLDDVDESVKTELQAIYDKLAAGEIEINLD